MSLNTQLQPDTYYPISSRAGGVYDDQDISNGRSGAEYPQQPPVAVADETTWLTLNDILKWLEERCAAALIQPVQWGFYTPASSGVNVTCPFNETEIHGFMGAQFQPAMFQAHELYYQPHNALMAMKEILGLPTNVLEYYPGYEQRQAVNVVTVPLSATPKTGPYPTYWAISAKPASSPWTELQPNGSSRTYLLTRRPVYPPGSGGPFGTGVIYVDAAQLISWT